jgi:uncharacterized protein (TIGR00369 family)
MHQALVDFFLTQIPFNLHLGMTVDELESGRCVLRIPFRQEFIGDPLRPALHGGVVSTLADATGALAVFSTFDGHETGVSTVDLRVDYLRPAKLEDLICEAKVVRVGNRVAVTTMVLHHGSLEYVAAEGRGVYNLFRFAE